MTAIYPVTIDWFRIIIIQWMPNTTPTGSQILEYTASDRFRISPYNHSQKKLFKVLWDSQAMYCTGNGANGGAGDISSVHMPVAIPTNVVTFFPNPKIEFSAASSSVMTNGIYLFYFGNNSDIGFEIDTRLSYTDS